MTDEEKEKYRDGLIATCKVYCHIDYDDDMEILELMFDVTMQEMTELIPNFDQYNLTSRQKLLAFISVKELYDNRDISTHILTKRMTAILNKNNLFKIAYYINNKHFISIVDIFFHFHIYF